MKQILNTGDQIISFKYGSYQNLYTIERVTPKYAYACGLRFKREVMNDGYLQQVGATEFSAGYFIATQERKSQLLCK